MLAPSQRSIWLHLCMSQLPFIVFIKIPVALRGFSSAAAALETLEFWVVLWKWGCFHGDAGGT